MRPVFNSIALLTTYYCRPWCPLNWVVFTFLCIVSSYYVVCPRRVQLISPVFLLFLFLGPCPAIWDRDWGYHFSYLRVCYIHHLFVFSSLLLLLIVSLKYIYFFQVLAVLLCWVLWKPNFIAVYSFGTFKTLCVISTINPKHITKTGHLGLTDCKNDNQVSRAMLGTL